MACSDEPDEFYFSLPEPWNTVPTRSEKSGHIYKACCHVPKFTGLQEDYLPWRNAFLVQIHGARYDVKSKLMMLLSTMTETAKKNPRLNGLTSVSFSSGGYRRALSTLEREYGGLKRRRMHAQSKLQALSPVFPNNVAKLRLFVCVLEEYMDVLRETRVAINETIFSEVFQVLSSTSRYHLIRWLHYQGQDQTVEAVLEWAEEILSISREVEELTPWEERKRAEDFKPSKRFRSYQAAVGSSGPKNLSKSHYVNLSRKCEVCLQNGHEVKNCTAFRQAGVQLRRELCVKHNLCYSCLRAGCQIRTCLHRTKCPKKNCKRWHSVLLHLQTGRSIKQKPEKTRRSEELARSHTQGVQTEAAGRKTKNEADLTEERQFRAADCDGTKSISLQTITIRVINPKSGKEAVVNALVDGGCTKPIASIRLAQELDLAGTGRPITSTIKGAFNLTTKKKTEVIQFCVQSMDRSFTSTTSAIVLEKPAGDLNPVDWSTLKEDYPHLQDLELTRPERPGIDLILGQASPVLLQSLEVRVADEQDPVGLKLRLGWTVAGPYRSNGAPMDENNYLAFTAVTDHNVKEQTPKDSEPQKIEDRGHRAANEASLSHVRSGQELKLGRGEQPEQKARKLDTLKTEAKRRLQNPSAPNDDKCSQFNKIASEAHGRAGICIVAVPSVRMRTKSKKAQILCLKRKQSNKLTKAEKRVIQLKPKLSLKLVANPTLKEMVHAASQPQMGGALCQMTTDTFDRSFLGGEQRQLQ